MKFPRTKYGLACDPRGAQVTFQYQGRTLIGDVTGCRYDEVCGTIRLTVRHFNGEPWPFDPAACAVDVLERHPCEHVHVNRWTIGDENGTEEQAQCADCREVLSHA